MSAAFFGSPSWRATCACARRQCGSARASAAAPARVSETLAGPRVGPGRDPHESLRGEGIQVARQRRPVEHRDRRELGHPQRAAARERAQQRVLRDAQAGWRERVVVELRQRARGAAQAAADAGGVGARSGRRHGGGRRCRKARAGYAHMHVFASICTFRQCRKRRRRATGGAGRQAAIARFRPSRDLAVSTGARRAGCVAARGPWRSGVRRAVCTRPRTWRDTGGRYAQPLARATARSQCPRSSAACAAGICGSKRRSLRQLVPMSASLCQ